MKYVKSEPVYTVRWIPKESWSDEKDAQFWQRAKELMIKGLIQEKSEMYMDRGKTLQRVGELISLGVRIVVVDIQESFWNFEAQEED